MGGDEEERFIHSPSAAVPWLDSNDWFNFSTPFHGRGESFQLVDYPNQVTDARPRFRWLSLSRLERES
ncbi:hypothetical protein J6590_102933 [Homalodisca vitripennis]|nr:hypothetical protein J6590_102933 [Homalodisca vitripennis]